MGTSGPPLFFYVNIISMDKEIGWLLGEKYNDKPSKKFYKDVERLKAEEPVDYVIGFTEFLGCKIDLSKKPLIPRKETEFWVEDAIRDIASLKSKKSDVRVLDVFSGSGCVAVAILAKTDILLCDIADNQDKCLKQARINCRLNNINPKRYRVIKSNVFSSSSLRGVKQRSNLDSRLRGNDGDGYDFIFANPPYIPKTRKNKIQKSVLKYEPKEALFGGSDGLLFVRKFLKNAKNYLAEDGKIYMEFDSVQKKDIEKLIKQNKYSGFEFYRDQFKKWRWVIVYK